MSCQGLAFPDSSVGTDRNLNVSGIQSTGLQKSQLKWAAKVEELKITRGGRAERGLSMCLARCTDS